MIVEKFYDMNFFSIVALFVIIWYNIIEVSGIYMNLFDYALKYGDMSFSEMPFNEVDNIVFSSLSYVNFNRIVSSGSYNKLTIREAFFKYFNLYSSDEVCILPVRNAIKLLGIIKDTKRYGDLFLYNYVYDANDEQQFSALTIEINPKLVYVSFEGTDHLVSGWKEDFMMAYKFPVSSHKKAIWYINKKFLFNDKQIILGGHSKGGNLALVAGMYCNFLIRNRIVNIYNNDGPGLLREQFYSNKYNCIRERLIHIVPNYSIFGLLLYHSDNYKVIKSSKKGIISHELFTWMVKDNSFVRAELDSFCASLDDEVLNWLNKYDRKIRKRFVLSLFDVFRRAKVVSFLEIVENKKIIFDLLDEYRDISDSDREMLKDFFSMIIKCFKDVKLEEFKNLFYKND